MSTTEQRTGFRLPWSAEGRTRDAETDTDATNGTDYPASDAPEASAISDDSANGAVAPTTHAETADAETADVTMTWPEVDRRVRQLGRRAEDRADAALAEITSGAPGPTVRRTNALMAGLSKAMHEAAESARVETLERLAADAAERTEAIKAAAADESTAIKQAAENDITGVRDWSKAELARVREETETRIAARREALESETEAHAAKVEARIERVQRIVAAFEDTMADFFAMLLAETDPARVALLAEQLPEAPSLEIDDELEAAFEAFEAEADAADAAATSATTGTLAALDSTDALEAMAVTDTAGGAGAVDVTDDEPIGDTQVDDTDAAELDAAAAAEAEAEAFAAAEDAPETDDGEPDPGTPALSEEALAASLARMEIAEAEDAGSAKTELIVSGLVSVAGIAGFKRAITRIPGVTGVGVTSGPGGEFVYSVSHGSETDFRAAFAALPGFGARITGEAEGSLQITASDHNPET